jgi:hypothetical protein
MKKKAEADVELAAFKELDQSSKHGATPLGMSATTASDTLPPLPAAASGETKRP